MYDSKAFSKVIFALTLVVFVLASVSCTKSRSLTDGPVVYPTPTPTPTVSPTPTPTPTPTPSPVACSSNIQASLEILDWRPQVAVGERVHFKLNVSGGSGKYFVLNQILSGSVFFLARLYNAPRVEFFETLEVWDAQCTQKSATARADRPFSVVAVAPPPAPVACNVTADMTVADYPVDGSAPRFTFTVGSKTSGASLEVFGVIDLFRSLNVVEVNSQIPTGVSTSHSLTFTLSAIGQHMMVFSVTDGVIQNSCNMLVEVRRPIDPTPTPTPTPSPANIIFDKSPRVEFGETWVSGSTLYQWVTATNNGGHAATITSVTISSGSSHFEIVDGTCRDLPVLHDLGSCTVKIAFHPLEAGEMLDNLAVSYNRGGDCGYETKYLPLRGIGKKDLVVQAGHQFSCALKNGQVKCWGDNTYGQLGDGTRSVRLSPVQVSGLESGVISLAVGGWHACAIKEGGGVFCWGHNGQGQLGDGTCNDRAAPGPVTSLQDGVTSIAAGSRTNCAIQGGALKCWGHNRYGQVGDGSYHNNRTTAVQVLGLGSGVTHVAVGADTHGWPAGDHACAIQSGALKCWGYNYHGAVGDGTSGWHSRIKASPQQVSGLESGVIGVALGRMFSFALMSDKHLVSWGLNDWGELGDGSHTDRSAPGYVSGMNADVSFVTAGRHHTCSIKNGVSYCWGYNGHGQLGDGSYTSTTAAHMVSGLDRDMVSMSAGSWAHSCAFKLNGELSCFGANTDGQLGAGGRMQRTVPVRVIGY